MAELKLKVLIASYPYAGNGASNSLHPDVGDWIANTVGKGESDSRVEAIGWFHLSDTPIPMTRCASVLQARKWGADVLIMIDSDMQPDSELRCDPNAKPFWDSSFDFLYKHWHRGPVVVAAPYCGPPRHENVFVFTWQSEQSHQPNVDYTLAQYTRDQAARFTGIMPVAALPTGLIMYDIRAFELTEPKKEGDRPWYYYEYPDIYCAEKASTEDVTNTRDMSLAGVAALGYNPIFCNWDAWAGHWKPKCVRKPVPLTADFVGKGLRQAFEKGVQSNERIRHVKSDIADTIAWPAMDKAEPEAVPEGNDSIKLKLANRLTAHIERRVDGNMDADGQGLVVLQMVEAFDSCPSGHVVEVGCNVGLTSVLLRRLLMLCQQRHRELHVYDSFQGLPALTEADAGTSEMITEGFLKADRQAVATNFMIRGLESPIIHEGWFEDTLPVQLPDQIAFALLDGDFYESIKVSLEHVWPRVVPGGVVMIHDYAWNGLPGAKLATDEFCKQHGLEVVAYEAGSFGVMNKPKTVLSHGNGHLQGAIA